MVTDHVREEEQSCWPCESVVRDGDIFTGLSLEIYHSPRVLEERELLLPRRVNCGNDLLHQFGNLLLLLLLVMITVSGCSRSSDDPDLVHQTEVELVYRSQTGYESCNAPFIGYLDK